MVANWPSLLKEGEEAPKVSRLSLWWARLNDAVLIGLLALALAALAKLCLPEGIIP